MFNSQGVFRDSKRLEFTGSKFEIWKLMHWLLTLFQPQLIGM